MSIAFLFLKVIAVNNCLQGSIIYSETRYCVEILHCRIHDNSVEYGIQPTLKFIEIVSNTFYESAFRSFKRQGQSTLVFCTSMQLRLNSFFYIRQTLDDVLRKRRICNSCLDLNDKGFFGSSNLSKSQTESFKENDKIIFALYVLRVIHYSAPIMT